MLILDCKENRNKGKCFPFPFIYVFTGIFRKQILMDPSHVYLNYKGITKFFIFFLFLSELLFFTDFFPYRLVNMPLV